jgi:hypothetical protein
MDAVEVRRPSSFAKEQNAATAPKTGVSRPLGTPLFPNAYIVELVE